MPREGAMKGWKQFTIEEQAQESVVSRPQRGQTLWTS